jgi:ABC-type bacteriocin/lantibiotic exporter with double-glycine peptidase domain
MHADQTFTTLALLAMVTHPANMVMTLIPQATSVMANFDRIRTFISQTSTHDARELSQAGSAQQFVSIKGLTVAPASLYHPILFDVDLAITRGEIVVCAGAVGSGKTTLAMALLGEATATTGSICISSKEIAYCAQEPWLPSVTIREAISGHIVGLDSEWYNTVVEACGLGPDLHSFVAGDMTLIENNGMNLSGGQKQRIV